MTSFISAGKELTDCIYVACVVHFAYVYLCVLKNKKRIDIASSDKDVMKFFPLGVNYH